MTTRPPFSLRLTDDLQPWLKARRKITGRSLNAEIIAILETVFENDPLTEIKIFEEKGRFVTASGITGERFRSYSHKSLAEIAAKDALAIVTKSLLAGENA